MSKKRQRGETRVEDVVKQAEELREYNEIAASVIVVSEQPPARPRCFTPRPCSQCEAVRPKNTSYSRVYHTRGDVRYCRCHYCGNTWTQYGNRTSHVVQQASQDETPTLVSEHGISGKPSSTD